MQETAEGTTVYRRELEIAARPETVWEFLVDPDKLMRWKGVAVGPFDARPGGAYRIEVIPGNTALGEFVELDPPRRLVYTWGWEAGADGAANPVPPGSSTVEIDLVPSGEGTTLHFTHRDLPSAEAAESHAQGWEHFLPRLAIAAAGGDPGPDPWASRDA
jgi:uncharacterized protein YndB with AHSA1/START domain